MVRADELLTAFLELEAAIRGCSSLLLVRSPFKDVTLPRYPHTHLWVHLFIMFFYFIMESRFVVGADEKLTAFLERESAIRRASVISPWCSYISDRWRVRGEG